MSTNGEGEIDGIGDRVLDLLFAHRMTWVQRFLRVRQLAFAGDKPTLRSRLASYLQAGTVTANELIGLLDEIEGWGDQHVYMYTASDALLRNISIEANVREMLRRRRCLRLLNNRLPLLLPDAPTLSAIQWTSQRIRFVWIDKRTWRERLPDQDREEAGIEFDAYETKEARGVVSFECDLVSGNAALLIQRLPSGNRYVEQKLRFEQELERFIDIAELAECRISSGIRRIDETPGIRKRSTEFQTLRGSRIGLTSQSRKQDAYGDPTVRSARRAVGHNATGRLGNFYFPSNDPNASDIHVKLYAQDQRIGIFGECSEDEVRHVLSRVRGYCN